VSSPWLPSFRPDSVIFSSFISGQLSMPTELILFWAYVAVGPAAWVGFLFLMGIGRMRMSKLRRSQAVLPDVPPLVSILVPAKDEGAGIARCIERIVQQDYPAFEIIAINDRSTDNTAKTLDHLQINYNAAAPPVTVSVNKKTHETPVTPVNLRVVHITDLPAGWLGKCHALHEGVKHAAGEYLFFVDSDVTLAQDALSKMVALTLERKIDAMSIATTIRCETFIEKLMLPLLAGTWMAMFAGDQTNEESEPDKAVANGQVFLIHAAAYRTVDGHAAVRDRIVEDVELMRLLKKQGFKCRFYAGRHLASTRMHTSLRQMFHGWARIFAGSARSSMTPILIGILFLCLCVLSVYVIGIYALFTREDTLLQTAFIHWLLMTIACCFVWHWSGNHWWYALLLPISVPIELAILCFTIIKSYTGVVEWRGMKIDLRKTST
jgi:cellulose synthase/poly-beta-1,6-N-acetylglucosamine synthase-like glycosyltransferase